MMPLKIITLQVKKVGKGNRILILMSKISLIKIILIENELLFVPYMESWQSTVGWIKAML